MKKNKALFVSLLVGLVVVVLCLIFWRLLNGLYLPVLQPSGIVAHQQVDLLMLTAYLSIVVVVPVFILLIYFALKYKKSSNSEHEPEKKDNAKLEILWWGIPMIIILFLSVITWQTSHSLDPYRPISENDEVLEVQVVALQWKWLFLYPEEGVASVDKLVIPTGRQIHFTLSAEAPMSTFWVPALGSQIYSMNAMSSQLYLRSEVDGVYIGRSTNINGVGYSEMDFVVESVPVHNYNVWIENTKTQPDLTDETYEKLIEPYVMEDSKYDDVLYSYRLENTNLYNDIIMKYMQHHGGHGGHDMKMEDHLEVDHSTMDHSMHMMPDNKKGAE